MQRWEYMTKTAGAGVTPSDLNQFGENGWEMVGVVPNVTGSIVGESPGITTGTIETMATLNFKRPTDD